MIIKLLLVVDILGGNKVIWGKGNVIILNGLVFSDFDVGFGNYFLM